MTSTNPTPAYRRDPAEASFRRAVELANVASLHDFLFPSQSAHVQHLEQMLRQPYRVSVSMSINTVVPSEAPFLNETKYCVLFPSMSIGSLSVMYNVSQRTKTNLSPYKNPYIARCVRDDQNGLLFKFAELDTGLTEIGVLIQLSPGVREQVLLVLDTEKFRIVMDTLARRGVYDEETMYGALIYSMRVRQTRQCPSCSRNPIACACALNLVQKRKSIDFDRDLLSLTTYNGGFDGVCYQAIHEGGVNLGNWISSVGVLAEFSFDDQQTLKLESWAMWDSLHGRENILKTVIADAAAASSAIQYDDEWGRAGDDSIDAIAEDSDILAKRSFSRSTGGLMGTYTGPSMTGTPSNDNFSELNSVNDPTNGFPKLEVVNVPTDELPELGTTGGTAILQDGCVRTHATTTAGLREYDQSTVLRDSGLPSHGDISATEVHLSMQSGGVTGQPQVAGPSPVVFASTVPLAHQAQPIQNNCEEPTPLGRNDRPRKKRIGRPPAPQVHRPTRLVPIVPAMPTETPPADVDKPVKTFSNEATQKVELQKIRNRQSAVQSNERKKKQVRALENNLKEAKEKEAALREQEEELRETNSELKARLSNF